MLSLTGCAAHATYAFTQLSNRLSSARRRTWNAFYSRSNALRSSRNRDANAHIRCGKKSDPM